MADEGAAGADGTSTPAPEAPQNISLNFENVNGDVVVFKLKPTTKFDKAFNAYARQVAIERQFLRFMVDGDKILPDQTPVDVR